MSEQELTRRNFLGLAGAAAAGAATLGLAGCAPKTDSAHAAGGAPRPAHPLPGTKSTISWCAARASPA